MATFKPIVRKPGDTIKSDDWNKIQEGLLLEIKALEDRLRILKDYIDNMGERVTLAGLDSSTGRAFNLNEIVPGETKSYGAKNMGLITKQWVPAVKGVGDICYFGLTDNFEILYYWSGAENGNKNTLDITLEYVDGTSDKIGDKLFINDRAKLSSSKPENPYKQFLFSDSGIWYKYLIKNKHPEKEVRYIKFRNIAADCMPRIANVLHLKSKIKPLVY